MRDRTRTQIFLIVAMSIACLGLIIETVIQHWEWWTIPLFAVGIIALWVLHITQRGDDLTRFRAYLAFAMVAAFYHGVHESSFFDIALVAASMMICFSLLDRVSFLNAIAGEYVLLLIIQLVLALSGRLIRFDSMTVSRVILHFAVVCCAYFGCRNFAQRSIEQEDRQTDAEKQLKSVENDMEDFLSNISHELRTPVNAVNGLSALMLKNEPTDDLFAIRDAGLRLSQQIEDIQDYTEIKRGDVHLEPEDYMITSLVNDVLTSFRIHDRATLLEFIVDLDPLVPTMMRGDIRKLQKILRHLINNAIKFTRRGGVYVHITTMRRDYGVNLEIEVADTGIGMTRKELSYAARGLYQANKKRNRETGGIGLGLNVVYGFVHKMEGFVSIESTRGRGTTVRISVPQEVVDGKPCLSINTELAKNIVFHVDPAKYASPEVRDFYREMATHTAAGLKRSFYSTVSAAEIKSILDKIEVSHIFMGAEEYEANHDYFDELADQGIVVAVSAPVDFKKPKGSRVIIMPKPLYGYPVVRILNDGYEAIQPASEEGDEKPRLDGVRALIVDDEPMNLIVATGLFRNYGMITETANSGSESIEKFLAGDYDVIFMDHMMPEMDGVEAMKQIKKIGNEKSKRATVVALTANAMSGAREMFMREGFDGFISKPINTRDFEHVMRKVLPQPAGNAGGGEA